MITTRCYTNPRLPVKYDFNKQNFIVCTVFHYVSFCLVSIASYLYLLSTNGLTGDMCQWNAWYLKSGMMTAGVEDYLLWHWFGNVCSPISNIICLCFFNVLMFHVQSSIELLYAINHFSFHFITSVRMPVQCLCMCFISL